MRPHPELHQQLLQIAAILAVIRLLGSMPTASAADAPYGAYLGCFASNITTGKYQADAGVADCAPACADQGSGIVLITAGSKCFCSNTVPDDSLILDYTSCQPGGTGVAAFYLHKDAGTTQCRVSNPSVTQAWKVANGKTDVEISSPDNMVILRLDNPSGARLESKDGKFLYGMFEVQGKTPTEPGAVATFYTRSSDVYPNEAAGEYSEIDWEFCNAHPCAPAGLWLNSYTRGKSNGERLVTAEEYQQKLSSSGRTDTGFTTYTLNWQPDSLSWAVNGSVVQLRRDGETVTWKDMGGQTNTVTFKSPNLPQMQVISFWTDTRSPPNNWGGVLDLSKGPFSSYFRNLRRVVCDQPLPADDPTALGPAWLYEKSETVPPSTRKESPAPVVSNSTVSQNAATAPMQGEVSTFFNVNSTSKNNAINSSSPSDDALVDSNTTAAVQGTAGSSNTTTAGSSTAVILESGTTVKGLSGANNTLENTSNTTRSTSGAARLGTVAHHMIYAAVAAATFVAVGL